MRLLLLVLTICIFKVLKLHGQHRNLSTLLRESNSLTSLLVDGYGEPELRIVSSSLEAVAIRNCLSLSVLQVETPRAGPATITNCPQLN